MTVRPPGRRPDPAVRCWLNHDNKLIAETAFDVIIVGLGALGCGAAYHLAGRGVRLLGIDHPRRRPGHPAGQAAFSMVPAIGTPDDSLFARRSKQLWHDVEQATDGMGKLRVTAGLLHLASGAANDRADHVSALRHLTRRAARMGIELEQLDPVELPKRYPALSVPPDTRAWLEPGGGFMRSDAALIALMALARRRGAVRVREEVVSILPGPDGVDVVTTQQTYRANKVIVTAGAWTPQLTGLQVAGLELLTQEQHWYGLSRREPFLAAYVPVFQWQQGAHPLDHVEGYPIDEGSGWWPGSPLTRFKAAALLTIDDHATADAHALEDAWGRTSQFRRERLGDIVRSLIAHDAMAHFRRWVVTADRSYIVDRVPSDPRIIIGFGGPATRFHDSIAVAEHLAALAEGFESTRPAFALDRPALTSR